MPSINDVAEKAGVSTATVSRTFRSPGLLNTQTHDRVIEAARLLNYKPRRSAAAAVTSVARYKPSLVAIDSIGFQFFSAEPSDVLPSNNFYGPVLAGAEAEAARHGFHLLIHTTNRHALTRQMPRMIEEKAIGGMLLVGTADPDVLSAFTGHIPHLVLVDNRDTTGTYESVVSDGFGGAYAATRYLLELGHKNIEFFCNEPRVSTFNDRWRGFLCAQIEAGLMLSADASTFGVGVPEAEMEGPLIARLSRSDRPTALLAANDKHAFMLLNACRKMGLSVPGDLSVIGFDDVAFSAHVHPPLTTVQVNTEFMGRLAVRRLLAAMVRPEANEEPRAEEPPVCNEVPVSLIIRQTCGSPKAT